MALGFPSQQECVNTRVLDRMPEPVLDASPAFRPQLASLLV
jgi:hypothetical protein